MSAPIKQPSAAKLQGLSPEPAERRAISIVVACRNEANHIERFLDSLRAQELEGFDWEVIIADGASDDGTPAILSKFAERDARIVVLSNPARFVSAGLNAAIRAARGEIILRMDAHTEYAPDYVRKCIQWLDRTGADNVGGPARTKSEGRRARAICAAYHSPFSTGGAKFHDEAYSGYVDTVTYGCWKKETLVRIGLFDEGLVRNQDDELNLRLVRSGGKIWQASDIVSWYRPRTTLSALFHQYFQYGFWKVRVIRKHKIPGSWRHLIPAAFVSANVLWPLFILGAALVGGWDLARDCALAWLIVLAVYAAGCLTAAFSAARRWGWDLLPYLPATFVAYHVSYGLGFVIGTVYWAFRQEPRSTAADLFVDVTR
jgi:succinoglycan biosynthesis protein ExoA